MRAIAQQFVAHPADEVYVQGELCNLLCEDLPRPKKVSIAPTTKGALKVASMMQTAGYHVYCSPHNKGAIELMHELAVSRELSMITDDPLFQIDAISPMNGNHHTSKTRILSPLNRGLTGGLIHQIASVSASRPFYITNALANLSVCDHMLLYLNAHTWTSGDTSAALAKEVGEALDSGVHIVLAHEMPGTISEEDGRYGVDFGSFFVCDQGATPETLLKRNVYADIAVPLQGSIWRKVSMVMLGAAFGMTPKSANSNVKPGQDSQHKSGKWMADFKRMLASQLRSCRSCCVELPKQTETAPSDYKSSASSCHSIAVAISTCSTSTADDAVSSTTADVGLNI